MFGASVRRAASYASQSAASGSAGIVISSPASRPASAASTASSTASRSPRRGGRAAGPTCPTARSPTAPGSTAWMRSRSGQLGGEHLREREHVGLACRVGAIPRSGRHDRADVDQRAAPRGGERLRGHSRRVNAVTLRSIIRCSAAGSASTTGCAGHAGVVDEQRRPPRSRASTRATSAATVRSAAMISARPGSERQLAQLVLAAGDEHEVVAALGQPVGIGRAEAGGGAGDQGFRCHASSIAR